jgi:hypothetical protein
MVEVTTGGAVSSGALRLLMRAFRRCPRGAGAPAAVFRGWWCGLRSAGAGIEVVADFVVAPRARIRPRQLPRREAAIADPIPQCGAIIDEAERDKMR